MRKGKKGKKSKSKSKRGKKAKMGRKSKSRKPKTGSKGKMSRKTKTGRKKAKKGPQRRGKNRRKPVRNDERDESEELFFCLEPAVKYLGQIAGVVANFHRQWKRAERHINLMNKKNNKTEIFLKVAEVLVEAGGGNVANLTCPSGEPSTSTLNALVSELLLCPALVNDFCGPQSYYPLPNMTLVEFCLDLTAEFKFLVDECVNITKNSSLLEACYCWDNPYLAELREKAREAERKLSKKKEENDPLFQFIIDSFKEEMERVSRKI